MRDASLQQRGDGEGQPGQEGLEAFPAIPSKCVPEGRRAACASGMFLLGAVTHTFVQCSRRGEKTQAHSDVPVWAQQNRGTEWEAALLAQQ